MTPQPPKSDRRPPAQEVHKTQEQLLAEILDVLKDNEAHTDAIRSMVRLVGSVWLILVMLGAVGGFFIWGHLHHAAACTGLYCR